MSITHKNDTIKIVSYTVNKGIPIDNKTRYNVVCYLELYAHNSNEPYGHEPVSLDSLIEKECGIKELYTKLMELPRFAGSEKQ